MQNKIQKITPFLWFDDQAEEAAKFYVSIFKGKNSKILSVSDMMVTFRLLGQEFMALNGGPVFKFTEAVSFVVDCANQAEVDHYWDRLSDGGQTSRCGWLKDRFGVSWQVVPTVLGEMLQDKDPDKPKRVMAAIMKMTKLDIDQLRRAYAGGPGANA